MFYFEIYFFQVFIFLKVFYYSYCYFIYFYLLVLLPGVWNLSFPTRDQTCTLGIESTTLTSGPAGRFHAVSFLFMGQFCISVCINRILYYNIIFISPTFCWQTFPFFLCNIVVMNFTVFLYTCVIVCHRMHFEQWDDSFKEDIKFCTLKDSTKVFSKNDTHKM